VQQRRLRQRGDLRVSDTHQPTEDPAGAPASSWVPLLTGTDGSRTLDVVAALTERIAGEPPGDEADASLSGGLAGIAVLHASLGQTTAEGARERAYEYLDEAIDVVSSSVIGASLYSGFTGVGWAAEIVDQMLEADAEDRNAAIDEAVLHLLRTVEWAQAPFDLINGLAGLGIYALERLPLAPARECVELVVARLDEVARRDGDRAYWWTGAHLIHARRPEYPDGNADLGVAHGVPGVVAFLARACAAHVAEDTARSLLDAAVRWVLDWAAPEDPAQRIPYFYAPGLPSPPARSAWCYGDPGVAAILMVAARAVGDTSWERDAIALAHRAASRPVDETGVVDAGFCHGSAGLGHLFNRMYQATGDRQLADAAGYWLQRTLDWCQSPGELARSSASDTSRFPWDGPGVLEGAAGVALVLLAAVTAVEPVWDRMFLVSTPRAPGELIA
jgi:hypothetical protein